MENGTEVKVILSAQGRAEEIRRFLFQGRSFSDLVKALSGAFSVEDMAAYAVKYKDEDEDLVTISSEDEFKFFIKKYGSTRPLRFFVQPKIGLAAAPAPAPAPAPVTPLSHQGFAGQPKTKDQEKRERKEAWRAAKQQFRMMKVEDKHEAKKMLKEAKKEVKKERGNKCIARFVKHVQTQDGAELAPNTPFTKTWRFRNEGDKPWPTSTRLAFIGRIGDHLGGPDYVMVDRIVNPGEEIDISVELFSPSENGRYIGYWRLQSEEGKKFGQRVWVQIQVTGSSSSSSSESSSDERAGTPGDGDDNDNNNASKMKKKKRQHTHQGKKEAKKQAKESALEEQFAKHSVKLAQLEELGFSNKKKCLKLLKKYDGNIDAVAQKLRRKKEKKEKKLARKGKAAPAPVADDSEMDVTGTPDTNE